MLRIIYESNIDKEIIARWEAQIDECFREKLKLNYRLWIDYES
jgi:hypothetical protein